LLPKTPKPQMKEGIIVYWKYYSTCFLAVVLSAFIVSF